MFCNDLPAVMICLRFSLFLLVFNLTYAYGAFATTVDQSVSPPVFLTPDESRYLSQKKEITFCVDPDWMPFEAIREGQLDGMTSDYSNLFAKRLGVPFRFVPTTSWAQSQDWAKAGLCDILPMIPISKKSIKHLTFTDPYLSYSVGIIAVNELPFISDLADLSNHPVGIVKGYSTWEYAVDNFPHNKFVSVEGIEDGLLKVSSGEISAFLIAVPVAVHNIKELGLSNLKVAGHIQIKKELRIGVSRQVPELAPIIKKLTASLTKEDVDSVYRKWVILRFEHTLNYDLIWKIGAALLIVMALIVLWNRKLSRLNKKILLHDKELQAAKERAEQYLHIAGTIIVALDDKARVQLINHKGCLLTGRDEEDILGKNWIDNFVPKEHRATVTETFRLVMNGSIALVEHFENEIIGHDGKLRLISWHNTPLFNDEGAIVGALSSGEDITERRNAETELLAAKNEAEQASIAKTRFLASASHDLRQPVQAMSLFIHALKSDEHDPDKLNILGQVEESTRSLSELLNSLLDVSRLDAGVVKVEKKPFKIGQVFSHLLEEYEDAARSNNIQFDSVPCSLDIDSDQTLITSILRNLISNAFVHSDTRRILMGCRRKPGGYAELQVWDSGKGIPESHIKNIFNEFYQIDNEARHREKGLGLGLAIVKRVSDLLDHEVTVRSQSGQGSVFSLKVPVAGDQVAQLDPIEGHGGMNRIEGLSIVVIEDEVQVRDALKLVLENAGHAVLGVNDASGEENTTRITALPTPPDIIIADYRLANDATGVVAIRSVREIFNAEIPAFLLTGDTAPERIQEATRSGFHLVHKPVHPEKILGKISEVLFTKDED